MLKIYDIIRKKLHYYPSFIFSFCYLVCYLTLRRFEFSRAFFLPAYPILASGELQNWRLFFQKLQDLGVFHNNLAFFSFDLFGSIRRSKKLRPKLMLEKYFTEEIVQIGLYERPWMIESKLCKTFDLSSDLLYSLNFFHFELKDS